MIKKRDWSLPKNSCIPCRPGDLDETLIYTAVGRAVTEWEDVLSSTYILYKILKGVGKETEFMGYSEKTVDKIVSCLKHAASYHSPEIKNYVDDICEEISAAQKRRNNFGHGVVDIGEAIDYNGKDDGGTLRKSCTLVPSYKKIKEWGTVNDDGDIYSVNEPEWNYVALEIESFYKKFVLLKEDIEKLCLWLENINQSTNSPEK